jgi:calcium-translocating P-type ATPase
MGIAGTEVAKQAADIIIMDDNFTTIVKTVKWGRNVFDNIRKFLQFQLTVNLAALVIVLIGAASKQGTPLKAVQLLWVNLIMDSFAALALATEKPNDALLNRLPINIRQARFISNKMLKHIAGQAIWQVAVLLVILYVPAIFKVEHLSDAHYGVIFNVFVWMQIFNEINSRKINDEFNVFEGIWTNWLFGVVLFITILGQVLIVEFGGAAFHTHPLNWWQWLLCIAFGLTTLLLGAILRKIPTNDHIERTPYNVELTAEKLAVRMNKSVGEIEASRKAKANSAPLHDATQDGANKKNDLEV